MVDPIKWRETYLLEASIHDSDLLAGELGLSQKFLYRHRPGGLLPCPRALELEECLFRSRRVRRRCHDLWSCRHLNCRKPTTSCPLFPSSFLLFFFISGDPRGHREVTPSPARFPSSCVSSCVSSIDPPPRLARLLPLEISASVRGGGAKLPFERGNCKICISHVTSSRLRANEPRDAMRAMRSAGNEAGCNAKRDIFNVLITRGALIDYINVPSDRVISSVFTNEWALRYACIQRFKLFRIY